MWYWNSADCNEALPGLYDLKGCVEIEDDNHPFKTQPTPDGKIWASDAQGYPQLIDIPPPTHAELVVEADAEKASRIAEANSVTQMWQTQLMLGIITPEDKEKLTAWMVYAQAVQAVDTSTAPDITWPDKPE
ncbi:tail fiber assembly protein [Scandinavium goeteborgense]|uniref:tail fiber assembly protein n=1 Tax=Scandinavium goeteborgense TaxID=1851514 RepID=UPI001FEA1021|nr:tail fiber assembly protein [Scandinavium goeteborgense]